MLSAYQHSSVQLSALQPSAVKFFTSPEFHVIYHHPPPPPEGLRIRYTTESSSIFKPVSRAAKIRKTIPKSSKKGHNSTPETTENNLCEKFVFAYFPCENLVLRAPAPSVQASTHNSVQKCDLTKNVKKLKSQASVPKKLPR